MKFLKKITISGEFRLAYVLLLMQYTFYNDSKGHIGGRYVFPMPEEIVIRDLQILTAGKTVLRASIQPACLPELQEFGVKLLQLTPQTYCLQMDSVAPGEEFQLQMQGVMPLQIAGNGYRFVFPLGFLLPGMEQQKMECCPVEMDFTLAPAPDTVWSPTHQLQIHRKEREMEIFCLTEAGKDFALDVKQDHPVPVSLLRENMNEGIGIYRLCTINKNLYLEKRRSSVWLLLDLSGIHSEEKTNAVKELLYRAVESLPEDILIHIWCTSEKLPVFHGFRMAQSEDQIFSVLEKTDNGKGSLAEMFLNLSTCKDLQSGDLVLLFTGGSPAQPEAALKMKKKLPAVHLMTTGAVANTEFVHRWKNGQGGEKCVHVHFYEQEAPQYRLPDIINRLLYPSIVPLVTAEDGVTEEMLTLPDATLGMDGYVDVAVRYTGRAPMRFALWVDGKKKEVCSAIHSPVFRNLPAADALFGMYKTEHLKTLLNKTEVSSHRRIKQEMLETGLRFRMINSETVFAIDYGEKINAVPIVFYSSISEGMEEYQNRPSIFGEEESGLCLQPGKKKILISYCQQIILQGICSDGSIAAPYVYGREKRGLQTAYSCLALSFCIAEAEGKYKAVLKQVYADAEAYLKSNPPKGIAGFLLDEKEDMKQKLYLHRKEIHRMLPAVHELWRRLKNCPNDAEAAACLLLQCFL
ncbi:vWA domain-containing protein [Ructibacterium gallinarum]|uniref:VIT domain-containing protein n=1 Tax=Ructibacterium gallinarum TaxID=2779355 RepID=A0A9D5M3W5_9FIRM|nr:hypothetical protein [Ructibacterium gallinarum]MBE5040145.1 hypothetical protein [Ructibacterium gallinarum]